MVNGLPVRGQAGCGRRGPGRVTPPKTAPAPAWFTAARLASTVIVLPRFRAAAQAGSRPGKRVAKGILTGPASDA